MSLRSQRRKPIRRGRCGSMASGLLAVGLSYREISEIGFAPGGGADIAAGAGTISASKGTKLPSEGRGVLSRRFRGAHWSMCVANSSASTLLSLALARPLRPWSGHSNRHGALRVDRIIETGDLRRGNFAISFEFQAPVAGNADAVWYGRSFHNGCHTGCGFGLAGKQEQLEQLNIFGPKRAVHLAR